MHKEREVEIKSRDYWFKVVDFLQQNWALIDEVEDGVIVWFFSDTSGVFDEMILPRHSLPCPCGR